MNFYTILRSAHSGWRYVVFLLLAIALINALMGWLGKKKYTEKDRKLNVFALISAHIQFVFGLILYFVSPLVEAGIRYWKMEHIGMMLFAVILITVGNARSKKVSPDVAKHRNVAIYFGLAVLIVVAALIAMTKADPSKTFFGMS
ncbi:MAG: cytochrome B [Sphingobacteriales bacterium]|nr:MAG: cytochrome B [Sphingobacteriales bacterium]